MAQTVARSGPRFVAPVLVALCAFTSPATQAAVNTSQTTTLAGWRGYKFGMTMAQARHVPGAVLSGKPLKSTMGLGDTLFFHTRENSLEARVGLRFLPVSGLRSISLQFDGNLPGAWGPVSPADCEAKYRDLLKASEARYGAFGTRATKNNNLHFSIRNVQNGQSRYSIISPPEIHPGWRVQSGDAVRYYGPRFVTVQMQIMKFGKEGSTCQLSLALVDPT